MRLLVYPHELSMGGSQINAIDLAAAAADAGHEVMVYGVPGPLVDYVAERGLTFIPAHPLKYRPGLSRIVQLAAIARRHRIDLIHAYEWPTCLDAYFGATLLLGVPVLCTVLSMEVMAGVPASVPLIMGTADLGDKARRVQEAPVWVLEPPIDILRDNPDINDGLGFRRDNDVGDAQPLVVCVSRLAIDLKLDALVRAIDAVDRLAEEADLKFVLVGDGAARGALELRGAAVNRRHGREVIRFAGQSMDPRPAYAAADVVVGMGSSALRALAFARPVIVQGEEGFSEIFEPSTSGLFLGQGFYGIGDGRPGSDRLARQIHDILDDPDRRRALGDFGRQMVTNRFSLGRAGTLQLEIYRQVLAKPPARRWRDAWLAAHRAFMVEVDNHNPGKRRRKQAFRAALLDAAGSGTWPAASPHRSDFPDTRPGGAASLTTGPTSLG